MEARDIKIMEFVSGIATAAVGNAKLDLDKIENLVETLFATMHTLLEVHAHEVGSDRYIEVMGLVSRITTAAVENARLDLDEIDELVKTVFPAMCKLLEA